MCYTPLYFKCISYLGQRHVFIFFWICFKMLPCFSKGRMEMVIALFEIFCQNRVDKTLAELFFYIREEDQHHHGIPINIGWIDISIVKTFQKSGSILTILIFNPPSSI